MPKPKTAKKTTATEERLVKYPQIAVEVYAEGGELGPLTVARAKEMLGWSEVESGGQFKSHEGKQIICRNNMHNRPLGEGWGQGLGQDMGKRHWADSRNGGTRTYKLHPDAGGGEVQLSEMTQNGEPIIVDRYGDVGSGQHRLYGLVDIGQKWADPKIGTWKQFWPDAEPSIEAIVIYGVSDDDRVQMTYDNTKPQSTDDVMSRDQSLFPKAKADARAVMIRMLSWAIRMLWSRTGCKLNAFSQHRTRSEEKAFLVLHPRILQCVQHIYEENQAEKDEETKKTPPPPIGRYLSPGYASAILYLMGSSASDGDGYRNPRRKDEVDQPRSERGLDWSCWEKAQEFWAFLGGDGIELVPVGKALRSLRDPDTDRDGSLAEKLAVLAKAWATFVSGSPITAHDLKLRYNEDDPPVLQDTADFGGIDLPEPVEAEGEGPANEEELQRAKDEARRQKAEEISSKLIEKRQEKLPTSPTVAEPGTGDGKSPGKPPAPKLKTIGKAKPAGPPPDGSEIEEEAAKNMEKQQATERKENRKANKEANTKTKKTPKKPTRIQEAQTQKARAADEAMAASKK